MPSFVHRSWRPLTAVLIETLYSFGGIACRCWYCRRRSRLDHHHVHRKLHRNRTFYLQREMRYLLRENYLDNENSRRKKTDRRGWLIDELEQRKKEFREEIKWWLNFSTHYCFTNGMRYFCDSETIVRCVSDHSLNLFEACIAGKTIETTTPLVQCLSLIQSFIE